MYYDFLFLWQCGPTRARASSFFRLLDHTQRRTIFRRTVPDEWSALRKGLYLTTHIFHRIQTSMPAADFEPTIAAREWPQTRLRLHGPWDPRIIALVSAKFKVVKLKSYLRQCAGPLNSVKFHILRDITCVWSVGNGFGLAPFRVLALFYFQDVLNSCLPGAIISLCANIPYVLLTMRCWTVYT
jgi:hypothetical protein